MGSQQHDKQYEQSEGSQRQERSAGKTGKAFSIFDF